MSIPPSMLALTLFSNIDLYTFPCSETSKPDINMPQPSAEALEEGRKTRGQEKKKKEKKDREATASTKGSGKGRGKCLLFSHSFPFCSLSFSLATLAQQAATFSTDAAVAAQAIADLDKAVDPPTPAESPEAPKAESSQPKPKRPRAKKPAKEVHIDRREMLPPFNNDRPPQAVLESAGMAFDEYARSNREVRALFFSSFIHPSDLSSHLTVPPSLHALWIQPGGWSRCEVRED